MTVRTIKLYGRAAELFGAEFRLAVANIPEAIRALCCQLKGFRQFLEAHDFQVVRGKTRESGMEIGEEHLYVGLGKSDLHIMPVLTLSGGSKMQGIGKILAGVLLAGFGFFAAPALGMTSVLGMSANQVGMIGIGLAIQGVSSLMSQQEDTKEQTSKIFSGIPEVAEQGIPVPVVYGKIRIDDPPVISIDVETKNVGFGGEDGDDNESDADPVGYEDNVQNDWQGDQPSGKQKADAENTPQFYGNSHT